MDMKEIKKEHQWFRDAGVGMFIHWGVYSAVGRGTWCKYIEKIPDEQYWSFIPQFKAERYDPEKWAILAKEAGMKYMVLTTKHHDGYCLFNTSTTNLNSVRNGPEKDLVAQYVEACKKHQLKVGLYFSLPDWSIPAFFDGPDNNPEGWSDFLEHTKTQLKELLSNYGDIDLLWYDNILAQSGNRPLTAEDYQSCELNRMVRDLQPNIIINDRSLLPEDFYTAEQKPLPPKEENRPWEVCMTMNKHWSYYPADNIWKSPAELVNILTGVAAAEGNLLLNVGPRPDGTLPQENIDNLKTLGKWLRSHGEAIYGVQRCVISNGGTFGTFTQKEDIIYAIVHWWHGTEIVLPDFPFEIKKAWIIGTGDNVNFKRDSRRVIMYDLPTNAPDELCSIIAIKTGNPIQEFSISASVETNFREQRSS